MARENGGFTELMINITCQILGGGEQRPPTPGPCFSNKSGGNVLAIKVEGMCRVMFHCNVSTV